MKSVTARAFLTLAIASRHARAFTPSHAVAARTATPSFSINYVASTTSTARFMSSTEPPSVTQIGKAELNEILEDIENSSREESGYVVIDVRNPDEIIATGKLADCVETLPLPFIAQANAFNMSEEEFEENFHFKKPSMDETIVLSCKAGIRSMHAAQFAAMAGYTNLVNYSGGADDWFR